MKRLNFSLIVGLFLMVFTACNGNSEKAMPMTQENMSEYVQQVLEATKSIDISASMPSKVKHVFKKPLERMGYDFDETIINMTKVFANAKLTDFTRITAEMAKIHTQILYAIQQQPEQLVKEDFIGKETKNKILTYLHFREMTPKTIQALKYVEECQKNNGGICEIKQYVNILLNSNFVTPSKYFEYKTEFSNLSADEVFYEVNKKEEERLSYAQLIVDKDKLEEAEKEYRAFKQKAKIHKIVSHEYKIRFSHNLNKLLFSKYLVDQNGKNLNSLSIEKWTKPFRLKDGTIKELSQYDPWWVN